MILRKHFYNIWRALFWNYLMKLPNIRKKRISKVQNTKETNNYHFHNNFSYYKHHFNDLNNNLHKFNNHNSNYSITPEKSVDVNADGRRVSWINLLPECMVNINKMMKENNKTIEIYISWNFSIKGTAANITDFIVDE